MLAAQLKILRVLCVAIIELIDLQCPEEQSEITKDLGLHPCINNDGMIGLCLHEEAIPVPVMGNPGLKFCRQCGATVTLEPKE